MMPASSTQQDLAVPTMYDATMTGCLDTVRRAVAVLGQVPEVAWLCVFPATAPDRLPRVHVMVKDPEVVRGLARLDAAPSGVPAFADHPTDPSWAGRIGGVWLHVAVDFPPSSEGVA